MGFKNLHEKAKHISEGRGVLLGIAKDLSRTIPIFLSDNPIFTFGSRE